MGRENSELVKGVEFNLMPDDKTELKMISGRKHKLARVIALIILSVVLLVGTIWGVILYSFSGPYNYSRGVMELKKDIPGATELFWNNEHEFRRIALEITNNEVVNTLNISHEELMVSSAFRDSRGIFFRVERRDLSDLFIACDPDFEYYSRFMAYSEELCEDWYILIINSPRG
ncbi:MAG: hypothetical protein FWH55_08870 [Oscillospiraceae bacterium]|nr:hypothetical protein [Oscillospiraceae bacterium]